MENTRFTQGMEQLKAIDGKGGENVIKSLEDIAPDLGKFIVEFAFGDIYTREGLTTEEREMITLSSLLTIFILFRLRKKDITILFPLYYLSSKASNRDIFSPNAISTVLLSGATNSISFLYRYGSP